MFRDDRKNSPVFYVRDGNERNSRVGCNILSYVQLSTVSTDETVIELPAAELPAESFQLSPLDPSARANVSKPRRPFQFGMAARNERATAQFCCREKCTIHRYRNIGDYSISYPWSARNTVGSVGNRTISFRCRDDWSSSFRSLRTINGIDTDVISTVLQTTRSRLFIVKRERCTAEAANANGSPDKRFRDVKLRSAHKKARTVETSPSRANACTRGRYQIARNPRRDKRIHSPPSRVFATRVYPAARETEFRLFVVSLGIVYPFDGDYIAT